MTRPEEPRLDRTRLLKSLGVTAAAMGMSAVGAEAAAAEQFRLDGWQARRLLVQELG